MQKNDIRFLTDNHTTKKETEMKTSKIITQNWENLIFIQHLNFHVAPIKIDSKDLLLTKDSYVDDILLVRDHAENFTSFKRVLKKDYYSKNHTWHREQEMFILYLYMSVKSLLIFFQLLKLLNFCQMILLC